MKHTLAIVLLMIASSALAMGQSTQQVSTLDQQTAAQLAAKAELNETVRAYKAGKYAEAQRHSERALELDPANKHAPSFIARSIHAQYQEGDESPENIAIARDAIAAYQRLLLIEPENEEAFETVSSLYEDIGEDDLQYSWILHRAVNPDVSVGKRVEAYGVLAGKDRDFSFGVVNRSPNDPKEFEKAKQRAMRGMEIVETAITLDSENDAIWSLKTNLFLMMAKLSELEGNEIRGSEYGRLANEALVRTNELTDKRLQSLEDAKPDNRDAVPPGTISGGVLNGKAITKPQPPYPAIAKTARAHGTVVVQILVDEEGKVISASAVSGHPLLRAAAVQAARQARFSPTMLNGKPAKLTGVVFYIFTLS